MDLSRAFSARKRSRRVCRPLRRLTNHFCASFLGFRFAPPEALRCRLLRRLVERFIYSPFTIHGFLWWAIVMRPLRELGLRSICECMNESIVNLSPRSGRMKIAQQFIAGLREGN